MSSSLPANYSRYNDILKKNGRAKGQANNEDDDNENGKGPDSLFNQSFEDVKEIQQDGYTLTVIKTQSVYRKENERRGRFGEYSLLLRRTMDIKSQARPKVQLEIQSDRLRAAFAVLARNLTTIRLSHDPIVIPEPFMEIYYCRHEIREAVRIAKEENEAVGAELELLVDFQREYMAETIKTIDQFKINGYIEFEWLWALFPPGELVVIENRSASSLPIQWCAAIKTFTFRRLDNGVAVWCITVTHTGFNGVRFGTVETSITFPSFSNNIPISRLPAYPVQFCKNPDVLRDAAIRRGAKYELYCMASSRQKEKPIGTPLWHDGPVWTEREPGADDRRGCRIFDSPSNTVSPVVVSKSLNVLDTDAAWARR
ncbi:hypothetical protein IMZ48_04305 [Candidatus Bathyarchaeota archaeon]|nr:hypothetical protein [Candidatus Bathyarchaeota archaeon]